MSNGKMGEFDFSIFNNTTKAKKNLVDTPKAYQQDPIFFIIFYFFFIYLLTHSIHLPAFFAFASAGAGAAGAALAGALGLAALAAPAPPAAAGAGAAAAAAALAGVADRFTGLAERSLAAALPPFICAA